MNTIKIKHSLLQLFTLASITMFISCDTDETQTITTKSNLVMEEEFEGSELNSEMWSYNIGTGTNGWGNNELQYYTDRTENVSVEDGMLKITALQESYEGSSYTSGRILTQGLYEQTYGRIEARIQLPWGQGLWPAFWMLGSDIDTVGWPQCGEIDIMEYRGQAPTSISGTLHGPGYSGGESIGKSYELENDRFDTGFHVFGVEWGPNYVNFYVDDVLYNQITPSDLDGEEWVFDQPFFIILNLAVGGDFVGSPNDDTVFPQTMLVDYIRVYE